MHKWSNNNNNINNIGMDMKLTSTTFSFPKYTRTYAHIYYYSDKRATTKENWQLRAAVHATSLRVCGCVCLGRVYTIQICINLYPFEHDNMYWIECAEQHTTHEQRGKYKSFSFSIFMWWLLLLLLLSPSLLLLLFLFHWPLWRMATNFSFYFFVNINKGFERLIEWKWTTIYCILVRLVITSHIFRRFVISLSVSLSRVVCFCCWVHCMPTRSTLLLLLNIIIIRVCAYERFNFEYIFYQHQCSHIRRERPVLA